MAAKYRYRTHPVTGKLTYVHRLVMEEALGRPLRRDEIVHHKNHDGLDNRLENLELVEGHSHHMSTHHRFNRKYSDKQILDAIRSATRTLGRVPERKELRQLSGIGGSTAEYRFGSWTGAVNQALGTNFGVKSQCGRNRISDEDIKADLVRVGALVGRVPTGTDYERHGGYYASTLYVRYGRWSHVLTAHGLIEPSCK